MSNLLKSRNIICTDKETKVIDYNAAISEKIAKLRQDMQFNDAIGENEGFVEGLSAEHVELLVEDEPLEEIQERADEIIARANEEASAIINRAREEADILKQESADSGREQGYKEGYNKGTQEFEALKKELEEEKIRLKQEYDEQVLKIEPVLVDTILKVFEKVTYVLSEDNKDLVLNLVNSVLTKSEVSKEFLIKVSSYDYDNLVSNREKIYGAVSKKVQIEIIEEASFEKNQCVIESDSGIYDCSLDVQMNNLIETIRAISCFAE